MKVFARPEGLPVPVSAATSCRLAACLGVFFGGIVASGQEAAIQKIVMTGDAVPGLEEDFAFFRGVHSFEDGEVGFAGITTRTGSFFQNAPRGIYLSNTSGALSVIAEIDDADAFRSFGLPDTIMDSGADKTFAFDYFNSTDVGNFPVLGRKVLGEDREAFNPDDGSFMLVSHANFPDTTFFQGNFLTIWGGIMLNAPGDVLADATFEFEDFEVEPRRGLFVAIETNDVRNIVFENDPAPEFDNATFTTIRKACLADNGNVFFSSVLGGPDVPNGTRESLWMENQGLFQLLLREGHDAPGLPGKVISLTGLNMHVADMRGEHLVVLAGARQPGGTLRRVVWLGDTSGNNLTPIIHHFSSPVLENDDYFTATDQGPIAFTNVGGNAVLLDDSGNVYFVASGKFEGGTDISGIWKYAVGEGINQLLVQTNASFRNFNLLGANNLGGVGFLAENQDVEEVWTRSPSGDLTRLISSGETVESRAIIGFANHSTVSGLFNESNKTLGLPKKFRQLNDSGDLVIVARFSDTENDDDNRADEAILLASTIPPQTERYLWNGGAGDDDWHKVMNWEDLDTGLPATRAPGDGEGTEEVVIPDAEVVIDDNSVRLLNLSASGGLAVNQPLTLDGASLIEALELDADLDLANELQLDGDSLWNSGSILNSGSAAELTVLGDATLILVSTTHGGDNAKFLQAPLTVFGRATHEQDVQLDINGGSLDIRENGLYEMKGGSILRPEFPTLFRILNIGTFVASTPAGGDPAILQADFINGGGEINVPTGTLRLENFLFLDGGTVTVDSNAVIDISLPDAGAPQDFGLVAREPSALRGGGIINIDGVYLRIDEGQTLTSELNTDTGMLTLNDGAVVDEGGTLLNKGRLVVNEAVNKAKIVNEGEMRVTGSDGISNLTILDGSLENRSLMTLDQYLVLDSEADGEDTVAFENKGTLEIEGEGRIASIKTNLRFKNAHDGNIVKRGETENRIDSYFDNEGFLNVTAGTLMFTVAGEFGSALVGAPSSINVEADARLLFHNTLLESPKTYWFFDDYEFSGAGEVVFDRVDVGLPSDHTLANKGARITIRERNRNVAVNLFSQDLRGSIRNESGTLVFASNNQGPILSFRNDVHNGETGMVLIEDGITLNAGAPAEIENLGEFRIEGIVDLNLGTSAADLDQYRISNRGTLVIDGGGTEKTNSIGVPYHATSKTGRVLLTEHAKLVMQKRSFGTETFTKNLTPETMNDPDVDKQELVSLILNKGVWEAEAGTELTFVSSSLPLVALRDQAHVVLHGNQAGLADGNVGGLLTPVNDFENNGRMTLLGATVRTQGDFRNTRWIHCDPGRFEIPVGSTLVNTGNITGDVVIVGDKLNKGFISPGNSPGTIRVIGDFVQESDGHLYVELGGTIPGEDYDQFLVEGIATLGGRLTLACVEDVFPEDGAMFVPIVAESLAGGFDEIIIEVPSSRQNFTVATNGTEITAQAVVLDVSEFSAWRDAVFTAAELADESISGPNADPDGDRFPNLIEYVMDGNPKAFTSNPVQHSFAPGESNVLVMDFPWANGVADYTYTLQYSADLVGWEDIEHTVIESVDEGIATRVSISASVPDGKAGFARLLIVPI